MAIRIIKVNGKEYYQEVEYRWDPIDKRGKTKVLRHLGPVKPLNPDKYSKTKLNISTPEFKKKRVNKKGNNTNEKLEMSKSDFPPLTPPSDLIDNVLRLVEDSGKKLSRSEACSLILQNKKISLDESKTLTKHVGFALTILERKGKISRIGNGKRGDPYLYTSR